MYKFYTGAWSAGPSWLYRGEGLPSMPLFFSYRYMFKRKSSFPKSKAPWALDSGAYAINGRGKSNGLEEEFRFEPKKYAEDIIRFSEEIGQLEWAAPQDWLCTPKRLRETGMTVSECQSRTSASFHQLRRLVDGRVFVPAILQGRTIEEFSRHARKYEEDGLPLYKEPFVCVGSLGSNQTKDISILSFLEAEFGLKPHVFGASMAVMQSGLAYSADSVRWSYDAWKISAMRKNLGLAYKEPTLVTCTHHGDCTSCFAWAAAWASTNILSLLLKGFSLPPLR
jgi:hypothetical protein